MIRIMKQKNRKFQCTIMQFILLLAMMVCLALQKPQNVLQKTGDKHVVSGMGHGPVIGYKSVDGPF